MFDYDPQQTNKQNGHKCHHYKISKIPFIVLNIILPIMCYIPKYIIVF